MSAPSHPPDPSLRHPDAGVAPRPGTSELVHTNVSKLFSFLGRQGGGFDWRHVEPADYKPTDDSWRGVTRRVLVGERGESPRFHLRYFEIERGGYTTLEEHQHEHVVVVLCGAGEVVLGCDSRQVAFGDVVYVAPGDPHQFRNDDGAEPFGFLCIVNAERDSPRAAGRRHCPICE